MQILECIAKGERDLQDGRTFTDAEAQDKLSKWFD
jgi:predicted transcriptional regulator